jgi:hypothetical protein
MTQYMYPAFAFRQQEKSPIQVAFVARADEIVRWAGVPRKQDELLTGFQRFKDDTRINQEIVPFFRDEKNCSPTAIIIALRKDSGLGTCRLEPEDVPLGKPIPVTLTLTLDEDALKTNAVFEAAERYVNERLRTDTDEQVDGPINGEAEKETEDEVEAEDEVSGEESDELTHLGEKTLINMKELLDDRANWARAEFKAAISDFVKPASIIDGQHRAFAAAQLSLPFIVCGLFGAPWEEQVFQFTVVNLKPKRIPPSLITSIAGLSLTRAEQRRVEERLTQAGVKMTEVAIMSLVAYDDKSPFAERIDMSVAARDREEKLGYGAMKRIAKEWYSASRASLTQIAKASYATSNTSRARRDWKNEKLWFDFFCRFWSAVRDYAPTYWQKQSENRLFVGAHLWALQEAILKQADGQVASHWLVEPSIQDSDTRVEILKGKLLEVVTTALSYFPKELWGEPWVKVSQDTNAGRQELIAAFQRFIEEGKKTGGVWKNWRKKSELFQ